MKKHLFLGLLAILFVCIISCKQDPESNVNNSNGTQNNNGQGTGSPATSETPNIPEEYWGTWIEMSSGNEYYIDGSNVYKSSADSSIKKSVTVASSINDYELQSENVLKKGSNVYFRKGGNTRAFSIKVAGFTDPESYYARAVGTGRQGISGRRVNKYNQADTQNVESNENDELKFTGAVAGDTQNVTVLNTTASVMPSFNGENMGTIPIVEEGRYAFKTTYTIDSDAEGFCYGNFYKTYTLTLNFKNVGNANCSAADYKVYCSNKNLQIIGADSNNAISGEFSGAAPGKSKQIPLQIRYGKVEDEDKGFDDITIFIEIEDFKNNWKWEDSITIRFYRGLVPLKINAYNKDKATASLNGFVIYPDGRSKWFTVQTGNTQTLLIPWSKQDYHVVFSGASTSSETEMLYSFGFKDLAELDKATIKSYFNAFEPNNSIADAIKPDQFPVTAYLEGDDIDFYTINCANVNAQFIPVSIIDHAVKENKKGSITERKVLPGKEYYLDIKTYNAGESAFSGVSAELSTNSSHVTVTRNTSTFNNMISAKEYHSFADYEDTEADCNMMVDINKAFMFKVSDNCQAGTKIPFTVTFTDTYGNTWTDSFNITVED